MRTAEIKRDTAETKILLRLDLDGKGVAKIDTGCGFLDHMLTLLAGHGKLDLTVTCKGDTQVDDHHTVEDVGIALGSAAAMAADCRVDSRILFSAGRAALSKGLLGENVRQAYGLPIAISGKSPFFDRKPKK